MADQPDRNDPASQPDPIAEATVHAMTTEYAGYVNTGQAHRAKMVEDELRKRGYDVNGVRLADSPSLPHRVAAEEDDKTAADRRKAASSSAGDQPQGRTSKASGAGATTTEGDKSSDKK